MTATRLPIHVDADVLAKASTEALRLDITLTEAEMYMDSRSKDARSLRGLIQLTRELREAIEDLENKVAERSAYNAEDAKLLDSLGTWR